MTVRRAARFFAALVLFLPFMFFIAVIELMERI